MENQLQTNLILQEETYAIRGAIFEVYKEIGSGFLEPVYQECLTKEFSSRMIPFRSQPELSISYKGEQLALTYRPDFICHESIIIELKAVSLLINEYRAQMHNYLRATRLHLGLLVNFGHVLKVEIERIIL